MKLVKSSIVCIFSSVWIAYGGWMFSESFESYAAGTSINGQNGFIVTNQTAAQTQSIVSVGSYFNGGFRSLKFSDQDATAGVSNLAVANNPDIISNGHMVFTFDYCVTSLASSSQNPCFTVYNGAVQAIRLNFFNVTGRVKNQTATGLVEIASNVILSTGVWYRAQITVGDISANTYDLRILEGIGDGIEIIHVNGLPFRNSVTDFTGFDIGTTASAGTKGATFYIDNLSAVYHVPDPAILDDFESYTIGTGVEGQSGFIVTNQTAAQTQMVVAVESYFSCGLKSLRLSDQDTTSGLGNLAVAKMPALLSSGRMVLTFDYRVLSNTQNPTFTVYDGTTQAIRLNFFNISGKVKNGISDGTLQDVATNVLSTSVWYRAQITVGDISGSSDTYDLRIIEGVGGPAGTEIIHVKGLPFRNNVNNLNRFDIGTAANLGASGTEFYIDNIRMYNLPSTSFLDDFESYVVNTSVDGQNGYTAVNQTSIQTQSVVVTESYFSTGLKSLRFYDQDTTAGLTNLIIANSPSVMSSGHMVFSFDYRVTCPKADCQNPTFTVYDGTTQAIRLNFFNVSGRVKNGTSGGLEDVALTVLSTGIWYRAQITVGDISGSSDTYDLRVIEGVGGPEGTEIIHVKGLSFRNNVNSLTRFDICTAANPGTSGTEFYIDNLGVIAPIYVGLSGSDTNSGTSGQPLATIQAALDKAAAQPYYLPPGVMLKDGTYRINEPLLIEPQHSGITLKAEHAGSAVISGGQEITGWQEESPGLWSATVAPGTDFKQLFVNGKRKTRARTPNTGWYYGNQAYNPSQVTNVNYRENFNRFYFKSGQFNGIESSEVTNVYLTLFHAWTTSFHALDQVDTTNNLVYLASDAWHPITRWTSQIRFFLENYQAALDAPGEWFLDQVEGKVYYIPEEGEHITNAITPTVSNLLLFSGAATRPVSGVTVSGLTLEHCNWDVPRTNSADGQLHRGMRSYAVYGNYLKNAKFSDCVIRHVGADAVWLENGCRDVLVQKNHFYDIGGTAFKAGAATLPVAEEELTRRITIDNNLIHDGGKIFHGAGGIGILNSADNIISHNEVSDLDYTGMSIGWGWGTLESSATNNCVEYNRVGYVGRGVLSDMAGIYMANKSQGSVARNNIIHDIDCYEYGGHGLYADGYGCYMLFESNLIYRTSSAGLMRNLGWGNIAMNNIFAYCGGLYQSGLLGTNTPVGQANFYIDSNISYCNGTNQFYRAVDAAHPVQMDYNLYWNQPTNIMFGTNTFAQWQTIGQDQNSLIADPLFTDPLADDFTFQTGSPALSLGFSPINYSAAGLYGDAAWTGLVQTIERELRITSLESCYIAADYPNTNYKGATFDGRFLWNGSGTYKRVLYYRFDLPPYIGTVVGAELSLSTSTNALYGDRSYNIVAITNEAVDTWSEDTLTWNNAPSHNSSTVPSQAWNPAANPNPFVLSDTMLAASAFTVSSGTPRRTTYHIPLNAAAVDVINADTDHFITFMVVSTNFSTGAPGFYLHNTVFEECRPQLILIHRTRL